VISTAPVAIRRRELILAAAGIALVPLAARAQQKMRVIGFMSGRSPEDSTYLVGAFKQGLAEAGFVESESVAIEYRWARGDYGLLPALAAELVGLPVAVLVGVGGDSSANAAKRAASNIPVVFGMGGDPVQAELVASLSRPGGNATGFTLLTNEMEAKRLGLLHDLVPAVPLVGALLDPNFPPAANQITLIENAARTIRQPLFVAKAGNDTELGAAFDALLGRKVGALLVAAAPYFDTRHGRIITFAAENRIPTMYHFREYALAGGLVSYGPSVAESYRQAGIYVGRILKGAKPVDVPILQPTKFELVVNLRAAKELNLAIPQTILAGADEIIE
jgi:ABC-type uncharacterized transport system substrate-binding protein